MGSKVTSRSRTTMAVRTATIGGLLRAAWLLSLDVAFRLLGLRFA